MSHSAMGYEARRQWPLWALAAAALLWFLITLAAAADLPLMPPAQLDVLAERATLIFPPLIVLLLIAAFLPGRRSADLGEVEARVEQATLATNALEDQLIRIDASLAGVLEKVEAVRQAASAEGDGLAARAGALEVAAGTMAMSSADMTGAAGQLAEMVPALATQAREAEAALKIAAGEARRHLELVEETLARVADHERTAGREAEAMVGQMQGLIAEIDRSSADTTKTLASRAYTLDAAVTGVLDRSAEAFASIGETLAAQARSVEQMVAQARGELDLLGGEGTRAIGQRLDVLLGAAGQLRNQFTEQMQLSGQLEEQAAASISAIGQRLEGLRLQQAAATEALAREVDASAMGFERRLVEMADRQRAAEQQQQERMQASLAALEAQFAELGERQGDAAQRMQASVGDAIGAIAERLEGLKAQQADAAQVIEGDAQRMVADVEARLSELKARQQELAASMAAEAAASLDRVEGRFVDLAAKAAESHAETAELMGRTLQAVGALGAELDGRRTAVEALEERIGGLLPAFAAFAEGSEARLPVLEQGLEGVAERGRALGATLNALADRIESQVALLRDSSAAFERDHAAVVNLSSTLAGEFEAARGIVHDIHATTEQTAIAAAARMVENVMQVRASVNGTAGEIRTLLAQVVSEAQAALDEFATTKAEAAFGAPIRLQIASLADASTRAADAAGEASERLTGRLVELMRVIADTERRVDEVDTRMDVRARDTLAARSIRLVDSLNEAAIDVARLLAVEVGEGAWQRWLQGDKGLFARATVRLADRETSRKIARHYAHDPEFEAEATRYLEQFEELIRRVLKDPDGESFALVLLSSDIGKLYVLIAEAIGRPLPRGE